MVNGACETQQERRGLQVGSAVSRGDPEEMLMQAGHGVTFPITPGCPRGTGWCCLCPRFWGEARREVKGECESCSKAE